eukprot:gene8618-6107_t
MSLPAVLWRHVFRNIHNRATTVQVCTTAEDDAPLLAELH